MPRKVKLSTAKRRAWEAMSRYVRQKAAIDGYCRCVTCGTLSPIAETDCGHFISRNKTSTFLMEENLHPQCIRCNRFDNVGPQYYRYMRDTYGEDFIDELMDLSSQVVKKTADDYLAIEKECKAKLKLLETSV